MLVANKMHTTKFGELPGSFDNYMILKDKEGRKNIMNIKSTIVPSTNLHQNSDKTCGNVADKPVNLSDRSFNTPVGRGRAPEKPILPKSLKKSPEVNNEMVDSTKVTNEEKSATNFKITLPPKGPPTDKAPKAKEDVLSKLMLDSDIVELHDDLRREKILLEEMSETIDNMNEVTPDSLKALKRRSLLLKPGPSAKKQKTVTDNACVTLRSVRKAVKDHT